jgi:FkbM family methyltransferase
LDLPDGHWLPQIRSQLPNYAENVGRLAATVESKYPGSGFIHVGANVGDTAAIVGAHSRLPVLCIEGSELYYEFLQANVRRLQADVELELALLDSSDAQTPGNPNVQFGTANFRPGSPNGAVQHFSRLNAILEKHPRFRTSKVLKIDTDGVDGRILEGALDWIAAAQPVLFWEHDIGRDADLQGPGLRIFERLFNAGYATALLFDNTGEFIQTISLDNHQQLAEISDYLPGGEQLYGYCDICAFHVQDADLCARFRAIEIENRRVRRKTGGPRLNEPLFRALVQSQFEVHSARVASAVQETIQNLMGEASLVELSAVRANTHLDRYRLESRIADLQGSVAAKDVEIQRLHSTLREMLRSGELRGQVAALRHELDSSLALQVARSLHWILSPIRRLIAGAPNRGPA